jgi:transmembrane sensor
MNNNSLHKLSELAFKYLKGELNEQDAKELNEYLEQSEDNRSFFEELTNTEKLNEKLEHVYALDDKAMWKNVVAATPRLQRGKVLSMRNSLKYAAAVIFIAALVSYWLMGSHQKRDVAKDIPKVKPAQNDILPGGNKAILTLANGQKIILENAPNGSLVREGKTEVVKTGSGQLAYNNHNTATDVLYNTVSTPKGGQYQLMLSDGTIVYLNAASSLHFPTTFVGGERLVELDGEAYFEVAKNATKPFVVKLKNGMNVRVLGTHFNIMAYDNEKEIKTTLLEGKVNVMMGPAFATLLPGQQALVQTANPGASIQVKRDADTDEAIAWKYGRFQFTNADITTVMRQVARWYDVDISYEGKLPDKRFTGEMSRNLNASKLLSGIEYLGVHFKIDGRKIIVLP